MLEKDRDLRYQSAADLRSELKRLKRDTDSGRSPVGVGLVPALFSRGTAPAAIGHPQGVPLRRWQFAVGGAALIVAAVLAFLFRPTLPPPKITGSTQVTNDRRDKALMVTDGSRVYFSSQLTAGPMPTSNAIPSTDGKKVFVFTAQVRGELVRYDSASHEFRPYLSGISAMAVNFSRDGQWVTYVTYPEGTLWRSKVGGSERLQLTFPPLFAYLPRWSPDGTRIAFMGNQPNKALSDYLIPTEGGGPEQPVPGDHRGSDPNWSPDGNSLLFGRNPGDEAPGAGTLDLEIVDLRTHAISKVPGSEELWSPR